MSQKPDNEKRVWILATLEKYESALTHYAARLLGGDLNRARDAVQHTFLRLCDQHPDALEEKLAPWLYTVCRNKVCDELRQQQRLEFTDEFENDMATSEMGPAEVSELDDEYAQLQSVIAHLSTGQREAIDLWTQGFNYREIAKITAKTEGAVRVLVHRAITLLKKHPTVKVMLQQIV